jgi:hypothetical protein
VACSGSLGCERFTHLGDRFGLGFKRREQGFEVTSIRAPVTADTDSTKGRYWDIRCVGDRVDRDALGHKRLDFLSTACGVDEFVRARFFRDCVATFTLDVRVDL